VNPVMAVARDYIAAQDYSNSLESGCKSPVYVRGHVQGDTKVTPQTRGVGNELQHGVCAEWKQAAR